VAVGTTSRAQGRGGGEEEPRNQSPGLWKQGEKYRMKARKSRQGLKNEVHSRSN
jgi:hypothetical protein